MPAAVPIPVTVATLTTNVQQDVESSNTSSAKSSNLSLVDQVPTHTGDRDSLVRDGPFDPEQSRQSSIASVWTKPQLIAAYVLIWLMSAVTSTFLHVFESLGPFVASAFGLHSLAAATGVVASVVGALSAAPTARLIEAWGRAQGLALMLVVWLVGLVLLASCRNIQTYAAAQVFTSVGSTGVGYVVSVFVADTTSLRNRAFMLSFTTSPDIVTMWIGGPIASHLLRGVGWRWGFGIFAVALPVAVIPLTGLIFWNQRKASQLCLIQDTRKSDEAGPKTAMLTALKTAVLEIDLAGLLILAGGLSLFLLPFTLYSFQPAGFGSPLIISFIAVGVGLILIYILYERYLAPTLTIDYPILVERTVLSAIITSVLTIIGFTLMVSYLTSLLQVVYGRTITETSYMVSSIRVAICVWSLFIGALVRWTGRLKLITLTLGIPLMIIAAGIWTRYTGSDRGSVGVMVVIILLISFSLGTTMLCASVIMMAALGQSNITVVLALTVFLSGVSPAVGDVVATGIWTGVFKDALRKYLGPDVDVDSIYSSLDVQLSFPMGGDIRQGIAESYGEAKFWMLIVCLVVMSLAMVSTFFWRDIRVKDVDMKATHGS